MGTIRRGRPRTVAVVDNAFGRLIHDAREQREMTVAELANAIKRSPALVYKWERGSVEAPDNAMVTLLASILRIDSDQLFIAAGRMPPDIAFSHEGSGAWARLIRVAQKMGPEAFIQQAQRRSHAA